MTAHPLPATPSHPPEGRDSQTQVVDFAGIFDRHFEYVWHALRRLGVRDRDLEDLTHDVFLTVYQRRDRYDGSRPVKPWLFGFAFRIASDYRRRSANQREIVSASSDSPDDAPSALDRAVLQQTAEIARRALDELELGRRAVFILHELDEFAMPDIAAALEIPLNTAYSRLRLARADLAVAVRRLRSRGLP